jgi:hypothetical protein
VRIGDDLFFAPDVRFPDVRLDDPILVDQLERRVDGFYFEPALLCVEHKFAFGAGLLIVSAIDFLAGLHHSAGSLENRGVGNDFRRFVRDYVPSLGTGTLPQRFFDEFRNGLSHEARIKNAGEFSLNWSQTVRVEGGRLCINPRYLLEEAKAGLGKRLGELRSSDIARRELADRLREQFSSEFGIVQRGLDAV